MKVISFEAIPQLNAYLTFGSINVRAIEFIVARSTNTEVRDRVASLLSHGQKVKVADLWKINANACGASPAHWFKLGRRLAIL